MIPSADSSTSRQKKNYIWVAIALIIGTIICLILFLQHPKNIASQPPSTGKSVPSRIAKTDDHTGNTQIASKGKTYSAPKELPRPSDQPVTRATPQNIHNSAGPPMVNPIQSIALALQATFTYETENGVALPQGVVPFVPPEDAHAYLEGPDGNVPLDFVGHVRFEVLDDHHIVVINNFFLQTSSDPFWSQVESLKYFDSISIPIVAAGFESSLKTMISYSCSVEVKGSYPNSWGYGSRASGQGWPRIRIPIGEAP